MTTYSKTLQDQLRGKITMKIISEEENYRGLFAAKNITTNEVISTYDGIILSQDEFWKKYPAKDKGKVISIEKKYLTAIDSDINNDIEVKICHGLHKDETGILISSAEWCNVRLDGYHEANHTLELCSPSLSLEQSIFIDSMLSNGDILCLGAYANSADLDNEAAAIKRKNNATFYYTYKSAKALLVATREILKGEEILACYSQDEMKTFSTFTRLLSSCVI
jgi:hypothetical protein